MISRAFADHVREQADIVRIISDYLTLRKRGTNYLALCPFHREKTPSFAVHPGKQIFKCFGCGVGGDVFKFVMEMDGCSWPEAVKTVAEKCGIPVAREALTVTPAVEAQARWRDRLFHIYRLAAEFFEGCLASERGAVARQYLARRGLRPETVRRLHLGYAPASWDALTAFLLSRHVRRDEIEQSGLVVLREDGSGYYDRFRHRLIFPISDTHGRVVGFGGRALGEDEPKYLNSPDTAIYSKGRYLYGLSQAREGIRRTGWAILVEGYFDFAIPFQEGIENVVASLGTALTEDQVRLLHRYTDRVVVNYDGDAAGRAAMQRNIERLLAGGLDVAVMVLPDGEDPDSFVRRHGAAEYLRRSEAAVGYLDFLIAQALEGKDVASPSVRTRVLREILPTLAHLPDKVERAASLDHLAGRLHLPAGVVREEFRRQERASGDESSSGTKPEPSLSSARAAVTPAERRLVEILLHCPELRPTIMAELDPQDVEGVVTAEIFQQMQQAGDSPLGYPEWRDRFENNGLLLDLIERALLSDVSGSSESLLEEARACVQALRRRRLQRELDRLQWEIEQVRDHGDAAILCELLRRKTVVARLLAHPATPPTTGD